MIAEKSVSKKMGIRENARSIFIHADDDAMQALQHPALIIAARLSGKFDYIHLFSTTQHDLTHEFGRVKKYLSDSGSLWVSWPKAKKLATDLNIKEVIRIGYDHGLVESKTLSVNATWSAIKFTHPKKGKIYNNSYGKLRSMTAS
jgi:hypothetical protein